MSREWRQVNIYPKSPWGNLFSNPSMFGYKTLTSKTVFFQRSPCALLVGSPQEARVPSNNQTQQKWPNRLAVTQETGWLFQPWAVCALCSASSLFLQVKEIMSACYILSP